MNLTRRSFFIGTGAAIGALTVPVSLKALDHLAPTKAVGIISPRYRKVYDISIGACDNPGHDLLRHTFYRNSVSSPLFDVKMHRMGLMRWVAPPGNEFYFRQNDVMIYQIDPCPKDMIMCFYSYNEDDQPHFERFVWNGNKLVQKDYVPLDAEYGYLPSM